MNSPYQEILVAFSKDGISKEKQQEVYKSFSQLELLFYNIKKIRSYGYNTGCTINTLR